ncbi:MAG: hypothetical protein CVU26_04040 [Betaproteobacteria bacterium HGW-Betaproteobacteria-2]|jgi:hypothetical protein|nr:MAG: hypothetical protein CVU26_04040 [Betaproteobacteria bacterium HGW-Betaproteobacteria-2]
MKSAVHLHLFIPQALLAQVFQLGRDSALAGLLAKAHLEQLNGSLESLLCRQAGIDEDPGKEENDPLPIAAISYLGEEKPAEVPAGAGYFLFADPVHLLLQRDSFSLSAPVPMALTADETASLLDSLNRHFASDGLRFIAEASGHWYLQLAESPSIVTHYPGLALDRDIQAFLPRGSGAARWHQLGNEIQMLLHGHAVNQRRESLGQAACNSLWFWGSGKLPQKRTAMSIRAYGAMPLLKGLGRLGGIECTDLPRDFSALSGRKQTWVQLDTSANIEGDWFRPAADALRRGKLCRLQLSFAVNGKLLSATLRRRDLFKLWRKRLPLNTYFEA